MSIPGDHPFQPRPAPGPSAPEQAFRILVVDDDRTLRRTFPHVLAAPGRHFDDSGSVAEAIARLELARYDLILLDYWLPDATGLDLLDWLAARQRDEAVIVISGEDAIDAAIGALRRGADDYVRKPYHVAQLQRAVDRALHKNALEKANTAMSQRLKASEQLHRYLVESSPDLIFTLDAEGRFSYLNPRVKPMLGHERSALLRRPFTTLVLPEDVDRICEHLHRAETGSGDGFSVELRLRRCRTADRAHADGGIADGDGSESVTVSLTVIPMRGAADEARASGLYGVARDISAHKRAEEIIAFQACHDQLTRLPNRALFNDRLELSIAQARRRDGLLAVMVIDIDRFKLVNDTYGHSAGDTLLCAIGTRLSGALRRGDTLARVGGDEFTVLLPDIRQAGDAEVIAHKILDTLLAPVRLSEEEFRATVSIGIALFPRDGVGAEELTRHADIAMHQVKRSGKNAFRFFDPALNTRHRERIALENDLRQAVARDELELHYQPQVSLSRQAIVGMEALVRWNHPALGQVPPGTFIQLAEEAGLIGDISRWVLEHACAQLGRWRADGHDGLRMAVNLSPHDFDRHDIIAAITACQLRHGLPAAQLELEITESMMMNDAAGVAAKVHQLRSAGFNVAIDDFGTGYSALAYLQKFAVSTLKIDRSFVRELEGPATNPIISAITGIARGFGLELVAEGVERAEQVAALRALGCDIMQGFFFARPAPADEARAWLQTPALLFGAR